MKQLKMTALAIALTTVAASSAMAQSAKTNAWEGAYGQVSVGYGVLTPSVGSGSGLVAGTYPLTTSTNSANNVNTGLVNIAAGYNFGINSDFVLGIGASYYPGASSSATGQVTGSALGHSLPINASYNVKNLYNVFLSPGYVIDKDRLAYLKIGYTGATIGLSGATIPYNTVNLTGYTLGLGYKQMVTNSIYILGEVNYASYGSQTASTSSTVLGYPATISIPVKASGTDFLIGLGYRF